MLKKTSVFSKIIRTFIAEHVIIYYITTCCIRRRAETWMKKKTYEFEVKRRHIDRFQISLLLRQNIIRMLFIL